MILYHRTWSKAADTILDDGFEDGEEGFVWLNNECSFGHEVKVGEGGDVILRIEVPDEIVAAFPAEDRIGGWKAHKIPAEHLNMCHPPEVATALYADMKRPELVKASETRKSQEDAGVQSPKGLQTSTSSSTPSSFLIIESRIANLVS